MSVVRDQMLCIITPDWPAGNGLLDSAAKASLESMFNDVGVVHFASVALLPPFPGAPEGSLPSLMLELAVDEGIRPKDLLRRLSNHSSGALWILYGAYWMQRQPAAVSRRNRLLFRHLFTGLNVSDGAFVGVRDRTLAQIKQERALLVATRAEARRLRTNGSSGRNELAKALSRWVAQDSRFEWATATAPRSFWRGAGAASSVKLAYFGSIAVIVIAAVWALRGVCRWLLERLDPSTGGVKSLVAVLLNGLEVTATWIIHTSWRAYLFILILMLIYWLVFVVLTTFFPPWRRWLRNVEDELNRPAETWSSRLTYVSGWLVMGLLVILFVNAFVLVVSGKDGHEALFGTAPMGIVRSLRIGCGSWIAASLCGLTSAAVFAGLLVLGTSSVWLLRKLPEPIRRWYKRPSLNEVRCAQQVHPSIECCEADLVVGTAHMISLTDLRRPYAWSAFWTRFVLRSVTLLGRLFFTEGKLGDAPGIHFGHWHLIGGRRLLFISNFDGSFGGYLDDFINGANRGTTLFWRWTRLLARPAAVPGHPEVRTNRSFPPTRFLMFKGVKCELDFKAYARDSMLPHLYRFDPCKLTIDQIDLATSLRDALCGERGNVKDDCIMRTLEK
ncbi:hypothetical protein [Variovorax saccharolyticus]|uniref:hypothetical protein n=1 Tax=Variovorax saccharolyticus TaxID=3053516 RepID=UPI0025778489|nr:hypothetical protein [Variovorax sp. J22R187]MDM0022166.1 hypothetical protein [Variovorax sp. J22R187]